jgi:hypothetical protein
VAGFRLFMSDSAMPTGCAGGLAGARRVSSGKRRTSGRSFSALAFDTIRVTFLLKVAKIVTDYG